MRKKDETLRECILECAREIIDQEGPQNLSIRTLSQKVGVASGTIYNYFANKDEILLVITEETWKHALIEMNRQITAVCFTQQLRDIYEFLKEEISDSTGALMNSLTNVQVIGRQRMQSMQSVLRTDIIRRIGKDEQILPSIWNESLSEVDFADLIIMNMMENLRTNAPNIDCFIEVVKRVVY
ncbi:hypothetical protein AOC36_00605 [Erysipelothrix larvae]|uniref:HTH tetR-type domain-containing protein n=1 Tax=Erysipelothrix larvae TaxID=1514105 RepID=A0A0X8GY32_9FIRM|nr:TetR/AcrR family transcriptional regulator [Erysipelothrix larvae]AMC92544.1 hypothetical protein AOC36_00605 [Erysipelothrix larvae]